MQLDENSIRFRDLFLKISAGDILFIITGTVASICMGILQPIQFYIISTVVGDISPDQTREEFYDKTIDNCFIMFYIGVAMVASGFFAVVSWIKVGSRQSKLFKSRYLQKLIQMNSEQFEEMQVSEITSTSINDFIKIERATGDKIVFIIFTFSMFISSLLLAFLKNIKLTLIVLPIGPLIVLGFYFTNKGLDESSKITTSAYKEASGVAEEALQEYKTVSALNAQAQIALKFNKLLHNSKNSMIRTGIKIGGGIGFATFMIGVLAGVLYPAGAYELKNEEENWLTEETVTLTDIIIVNMCTAYAFYNVATLVSSFKAIGQGKQAAIRVFKILNSPVPAEIEYKKQIEGSVSFENVTYFYPSFPENLALNNVSFSVDPGDRLGIVGSTGSGKSTLVALILRFFDPSEGSVLIDNIPISHLNLKHLRKQIAYVSQEPLLFNTSLLNNVQFGNLNATMKEIEKAATIAEAYSFIQELPDEWETLAGTKGSQLSGGQKQRIVIARAVLRKPKILILDESTSALDQSTEFKVLSNLDKALADTTWISIAQNLFTVRDSTKIILLSEGRIIEEGDHEELMEKQGSYYNLITIQQMSISHQIRNNSVIDDINPSCNSQPKAPRDDKAKNYVKEVLKLNRSDKKIVAIALLGCVGLGITYPFIAMTNGLLVTGLGTKQGDDLVDNAIEKGIMMLIFSGILFITQMLEFLSLPRLSANITTKMRETSLRAMLNFDTSFFDNPDNNPTVLSSRLSKDCEDINAIGESMIGLLLGSIVNIIMTYMVAAYFSWKISLVSLAMLPILLFFMMSVFLAQMKGIVSFSYEKCGELLSDFVLNFRSVKAFNLEKHTIDQFNYIIEEDLKSTHKKSIIAGLTYGAGFGIFLFVDILVYGYGAKLYKDEEISYEEMIVSIFVIFIGVNGFVLAGVHSGDIGGALNAARNIFYILQFKPSINVSSKSGLMNRVKGEIEFKDVSFSYPNRECFALRNVSFKVTARSKCAIIGQTGSGKSTIPQLLIRLYDPSQGAILIDLINIQDYRLKHLRTQIGIVSQEPVLFSGSISSNIAMGTKTREEDIKTAAKRAEVIEFIEANKKGLDREVGFKGGKLSGGQKQRLAIARCIVRKPQIVMLDEATSALDSKTEMSVLDNLFEELADSTFLIIAHRLKTIEKADQIIVLDSGSILETGSKDSLLEEKSYFFSLINNLK